MPNWIQNFVRITGPTDKINGLWRQSKCGYCLLSTMCPVSDDEHEKQWSTNRDTEDPELQLIYIGQQKSMIVGRFLSAWRSPIQCFQTWSSQNKDCELYLSYHGECSAFAGIWDSSNGLCHFENIDEELRDKNKAVIEGLKHEFPAIPRLFIMNLLKPKNKFQEDLSNLLHAFDSGEHKLGKQYLENILHPQQ